MLVTGADTAVAMGSGDVPVLATPRLLALAEAAAVAAVAPHLEAAYTTVGTAVILQHRSASAAGSEVVVEAELTGVTGTLLAFRFSAVNPGGGREGTVLGTGTHERVIVDRARFLARAGASR
jgi:predicted thioesterase